MLHVVACRRWTNDNTEKNLYQNDEQNECENTHSPDSYVETESYPKREVRQYISSLAKVSMECASNESPRYELEDKVHHHENNDRHLHACEPKPPHRLFTVRLVLLLNSSVYVSIANALAVAAQFRAQLAAQNPRQYEQYGRRKTC